MANGNGGGVIIGRQLLEMTWESVEKIAAAAWLPPVLIIGETGTGKGVLAEAIHSRSARSGKPFVSLNCGAIPPELIESELFGHIKGAFTGAVSRREGKFAAAKDGTLFLDEIGELPMEHQVKLLHVLDSKMYCPVGSEEYQQANCAIMCATNRNLPEMIAAGTFRADLYYRINVVQIKVPPLRARSNDILELLKYFLDKYADPERPLHLTDEASAMLAGYAWPGNVREVDNWAQRLCVLHGGGAVCAGHISQLCGEEFNADKPLPITPGIGSGCDSPIHHSLKLVFGKCQSKEDIQRGIVSSALNRCEGNVTRLASWLGISRTGATNYCKKFGLERGKRASPATDEQLAEAMREIADYVYRKISGEQVTFQDVVLEIDRTLPSLFRDGKLSEAAKERGPLPASDGEQKSRLQQSLELVFGNRPGRDFIRSQLIRASLELNDGNVHGAAALLGLSDATVYADCRKHGIGYGETFSLADQRLSDALVDVAVHARRMIVKKRTLYDVACEIEKSL